MNHPRTLAAIVLMVTVVPTAIGQNIAGALGAKPLKSEVEVFPFVGEQETVKFKAHDREVPDEFRVTVAGQNIQISGIKKTGTKVIQGQSCGHFGKLALVSSPLPQSGTITVKIPSIPDTTYYGPALKIGNETLISKRVKLDANATYEWSVKKEGTAVILEVTKGGQRVDSITAEASVCQAFGFFATGRNPGSKADILVTVTPASKPK